MQGLDWLWATLMMGLWIVLLGLVLYMAVRLARREERTGSRR